MNLTDVLAELRDLNEPVPKPLRLPTEIEVDLAESSLGIKFPEDYRRYLLEASDIVFGALEPAVVTPDAGYLSLVEVAESAWSEMELPRDLLPFCEDNGDYYCFAADGRIKFWSHNGATDESWPDLATWIKEVWIEQG
jgi:SUKH superfamily protein